MIYQFFPPSPALQPFVKEYLLLHFKFYGLSVLPEKAYTPRPEQCLTFDPFGRVTARHQKTGEIQQRSFSYFSGQQSACYNLTFAPDYLMLKVVFQPGALYQLFGIPLTEFTGYVDASAVLNQEMRQINEQLINASDYGKMIQIVERYLLSKTKKTIKPNLFLPKLKDLCLHPSYPFSLNKLAQQACLSPRQLERKFLEQIGVSPQLYSRIIRFHRASELKTKNPHLDWLTVAVTCGYTDFQHLNKDFKQFSGVTPTVLLQKNMQSVEKKLKLV